MGQAETTSTTSSRDSDTAVVTAFPSLAKSTPGSSDPTIVGAYAHMLEKLHLTRPRDWGVYTPDYRDLMERADHARSVILAVTAYLGELVHDTNRSCWHSRIDRRWIDARLDDLCSDVVGAMENAADDAAGAAA